MRRLRAPLAASAVLAASLFATSAASAFERQWHAGVSLGYSSYTAAETMHGFGGGLHLTYGLTDVWNAMAEVDAAWHPSKDALVFGGALGAGYVVDILQIVPYVGVMAGPYDVWITSGACDVPDAPRCHGARLGLSVPFGLDYTVSRSFTVGVAGHYHLMLLGPEGPEHWVTALARAELIWGY